MPQPVDDATLDAMDKYGGSFVRTLARLYRVADPENRQRLDQTFADLFKRYAALGRDG